jgi:hypothetical protein
VLGVYPTSVADEPEDSPPREPAASALAPPGTGGRGER